jgi:uncharacterized membrane protein
VSANAPPRQRIPAIDALRGIALAAMVAFHFCWDLEFLGLADLRITENAVWIVIPRAIAGSFLFLVGVSLVLAHRNGVKTRAFLRRIALIVAAALVVTIASWLTDPDGIILFGILHCIAVSSILALPFLRLPVWLVFAAALACFAAAGASFPFFNGLGWLWLGLGSEVLPSNDYEPLVPWFGAVLLGVAAARLLLPDPKPAWSRWEPHSAAPRLLVLAGRHTLAVYLLQQPVMLGFLWLALKVWASAAP